MVLLSEEVEGFSCPVVRADNRIGVLQAMGHLVEHGHRRIAFVGSLFQKDTRERYEAYREALVDHGIEPDASLVFETADNLEGTGEEAGRAMLAAGMPSTAAFAATDYNALGLMRALSEAGLDLPDDQAVVGFDDVEASSSIRPTLSTVRQTFNAAGRLAATLILDLVAGREVAPEVHRVPTSFVIRESCGCATGSALEMVGDADPSLPPLRRTGSGSASSELLNGIEPLPAEQSAALDVAVEAIARCAQMGGEGDQTSGYAHREAARALFSISPRWTTITASVNCARRYWLELEADREPAEEASHPQADITEILVELLDCLHSAS